MKTYTKKELKDSNQTLVKFLFEKIESNSLEINDDLYNEAVWYYKMYGTQKTGKRQTPSYIKNYLRKVLIMFRNSKVIK